MERSSCGQTAAVFRARNERHNLLKCLSITLSGKGFCTNYGKIFQIMHIYFPQVTACWPSRRPLNSFSFFSAKTFWQQIWLVFAQEIKDPVAAVTEAELFSLSTIYIIHIIYTILHLQACHLYRGKVRNSSWHFSFMHKKTLIVSHKFVPELLTLISQFEIKNSSIL